MAPQLAASVSSLSSTMARFTLPAPMQGVSPRHGAPPGWTTGAGTMKSTGATVIQTLARWRESGAELGNQASVRGYLLSRRNKDWQNYNILFLGSSSILRLYSFEDSSLFLRPS